MKKLLALVLLLFLFVSATDFTAPQEPKGHSLEGTWELVNRFNYDGQNVSDTIPNTNGYRQVKIYSKGKVMWTRHSPDDPAEWFGYGRYTNTKNSLEEQLEYGSKSMMKVIDTANTFRFALQLDKDTYSQITVDEEGNPTFSENYKRID